MFTDQNPASERVHFTPEEFIEQLESEHRIKPEVREARSIGFT